MPIREVFTEEDFAKFEIEHPGPAAKGKGRANEQFCVIRPRVDGMNDEDIRLTPDEWSCILQSAKTQGVNHDPSSQVANSDSRRLAKALQSFADKLQAVIDLAKQGRGLQMQKQNAEATRKSVR